MSGNLKINSFPSVVFADISPSDAVKVMDFFKAVYVDSEQEYWVEFINTYGQPNSGIAKRMDTTFLYLERNGVSLPVFRGDVSALRVWKIL